MIQKFQNQGCSPIYDVDEFQIFCYEAGAQTLFDNLHDAVCTTRQSEDRIEANRKLIVSTLYQLCFGLSQMCNFLQKDNAIFMISENLNKQAVNTQRPLGLACSSQTACWHLHSVEMKYKKVLKKPFLQPLKMSI